MRVFLCVCMCVSVCCLCDLCVYETAKTVKSESIIDHRHCSMFPPVRSFFLALEKCVPALVRNFLSKQRKFLVLTINFEGFYLEISIVKKVKISFSENCAYILNK